MFCHLVHLLLGFSFFDYFFRGFHDRLIVFSKLFIDLVKLFFAAIEASIFTAFFLHRNYMDRSPLKIHY